MVHVSFSPVEYPDSQRNQQWQFRELFEMTRARITDIAARVARVVRRMSGMSKQDAAIIMDYYRDGLETTRR
jgi:hypothetical protein